MTGTARAVGISRSSDICVAGSAGSGLPLLNPVNAQQAEGFLIRLKADGSELLSSTYIQGSVNAMVLDGEDNVYLAGQTYASTFPDVLKVSKAVPRGPGTVTIAAAFFTKLNATVDRVLTSGYLAGDAVGCSGGSTCFLSGRITSAVGIALDRQRNMIVAGNTNVTDLPTTADAMHTTGLGAFVAKIAADGSRLVYSGYLSRPELPVPTHTPLITAVSDMSTGPDGLPIIAGRTYDRAFPVTPGVIQRSFSAGAGIDIQANDGFVAKLNASGSGFRWATYLGAYGRDEGLDSVSTDNAGNVWLAGRYNPEQRPEADSTFVVGLNSTGTEVLYSGTFGSGWGNLARMDRTGLIHAAGAGALVSVFRPAASMSPRILALTSGAGGDVTGEVAPGEIVTLYGAELGPATPVSFTLDRNGRVPTTLAGIHVLFDGLPAPLLYVSATQINAIVPNGIRTGSAIPIHIADSMPPFTAHSRTTLPAIFADSEGYTVRNQDGSPNHFLNPARRGSVVSLWLTGIGADGRPDGSVAAGAMDQHCCTAKSLQLPIEVLYAGDSPGFVTALQQMNVRVPAASTGIEITSGGDRSAFAMIYVAYEP